MNCSKITQEQYDNKLIEILSTYNGSQLLDIPGVYEKLSEFFNNDIIDSLLDELETE